MEDRDERTSALEKIIASDPERLRRRSISLGVSPSDADDVAQTALLRAWRSIENLRSPNPEQMCSWLDTIARNAATDLARSRTRRPVTQLEDDVASEANTEDVVAMRRVLDGALEAIHALPPTLREPLLLNVVDQMSPAEIAERLDTTPAAVRQRISRARKSLDACKATGMSEQA